MKKTIISTIVYGVVLSAVLLTGCSQPEEEMPIIMVDSTENDIVYKLDDISKGDVVLTQKISCEYTQTKDQQVAFTIGGKTVEKVYVRVGDYVNEGDLLLTLDSGDILDKIAELEYRIKRNQVQLSYLDKQEEFDKQSAEYTYIYEYYSPKTDEEINKLNHKMYMIGEKYAYRRQDFNDEINYDSQKLQQLKDEYEQDHVYATMSGKVMNIKTDLEGSIAKKDEVIMSIVDNDNGLFLIDDAEMAKYFSDGQSVPMNVIYGSAKGDYELMPHGVDEETGKLQFEIIDKPQSATLEVGVSGTITATVSKKENVLRIPIKALYQADDKYYTYVLNSNNMKEAQFIEIGLVGDSYAEVLSGISQGMKVVSR